MLKHITSTACLNILLTLTLAIMLGHEATGKICLAPSAAFNMSSYQVPFPNRTPVFAGYKVGILVDGSAYSRFSFQPGLFYAQSGFNVGGDRVYLHNIEIPICATMKGKSFFGGFGPYMNIQTRGRYVSVTGQEAELGVSDPVTVGITGYVGIEEHGFFGRAYFQYGVNEGFIVNYYSYLIRNISYGIGAGYYIGKNKHNKRKPSPVKK